MGSSGKAILMRKPKKDSKRKSKTKFEEFLAMDMNKGVPGAEEDLELERRLAKKLKVKGGKLKRSDDGMDELIDGIPSVLDSTFDGDDVALDEKISAGDGMNGDDEAVVKPDSSRRKRKRKKSISQPSVVKSEDETVDDEFDGNVNGRVSSHKNRKRKKSVKASGEKLEDENTDDLPKMEGEDGGEENMVNSDNKEPGKLKEKVPKMDVSVKYVAPHLRASTNKESEEILQVRRRIRGLLNRLSESNVESITGEVAAIFQSLSRSVGCQIIGEEVVVSCSRGPRGNEQYAAVFAAFTAGMACLVGIDFSAKLIASIARSFEDECSREDGLSLRNLTLLLSYMCIFGVCSSNLIYDLLSTLGKRLSEIDVSTILTILQCCGMKLRSDDPTAMKNFVLSITNRVNEAKLLSESKHDGNLKINNKRMEFMLETICDIKNNKKKPKDDPARHTRIKKWLQKLRSEDILLRGIKWSKLLDPEKKGQWWLSGELTSAVDDVEEAASTIGKEATEAQKLMQLAAAQRMNTDLRRAIFCIIMSADDYINAFEKILRLDLSGKQDREIMRVLVGCCIREKTFNKYYTVLASKLCSHDKNQKFTLHVCGLNSSS